jgi:hypothetical protein
MDAPSKQECVMQKTRLLGQMSIVFGAVLGAACTGCTGPEPAGAPGRAASIQLAFNSSISGPSGLPDPCSAARSESQPQLVTHPDDPERLTAIYLQDGITAAVLATSRNGGATWERTPIAQATRCAGGPAERAVTVNPLLAGGPDGAAYFGNSWINGTDQPLAANSVVAHNLADPAGPGVAPEPGSGQNLALLVDRTDPAVVNALWAHHDSVPTPLAAVPAQTALYAARSTDGAATFTPPVIAARPAAGNLIINVRLAEASDGALLALFDQVPADKLPNQLTGERTEFSVHATRSGDGGVTWSEPVAAGGNVYMPIPDPEGSGGKAGTYKFDLATGPAGLAVAVHADRGEDGRGRIVMSRSRDDGLTWSEPFDAIVRPAAVFMPAVAIDDSGTIALFWYDWAFDVPGDAALSTDAWMAASNDGGATWEITHLAGPFDLRGAYADGLSYDGTALGVYQDVVALRHGFGAAFTVGPPLASDGKTDVWFARLQVTGKP